jgi:putative addiction module component (TIGR02574 family)
MTIVKDINLDKILALPVEDRQAIVEAIQASLDEEQDPPDWHREIVAERLAQHDANPHEGIPWSELRRKLEAR